MRRQIRLSLCSLFVIVVLSIAPAYAKNLEQPDTSVTEIEGTAPSPTARIVKFYQDPGADYEKGDLHILFSDGREVIKRVPLGQKDAEAEQGDPEGIDDIHLAADKRTIGWSEKTANCCTSYDIPTSLALYSSGKTILHLQEGMMLWSWMFTDNGRHVAAFWGTTHGPEVGDFQLYDVKTGRILDEVYGNPETQSLDPDAPSWAKTIERQYHKQ